MSSPLIVQLDMAEFCEAADLSDVYVIEIVEHGILEPQGAQPREWRFTDYELALAKRAAKLRRDGRPLSFVLCDVDHFKVINDAHGHSVGDAVLRVGPVKGRCRGPSGKPSLG